MPSRRRQGQRAVSAQKLCLLGEPGSSLIRYCLSGDRQTHSILTRGAGTGSPGTDGAGADGRCWVRCPFPRGGGGNRQRGAGRPVISPGPPGRLSRASSSREGHVGSSGSARFLGNRSFPNPRLVRICVVGACRPAGKRLCQPVGGA